MDLSEVTYLVSVGWQILAFASGKLSPTKPLAAVDEGHAASRPIQLTCPDEMFGLCPTLQDAPAGLGLLTEDPLA